MFYKSDLSLLSTWFKALTCKTRLKILLVIKNEPRSIRRISQEYDVVYNVAIKHIKIMKSCDLVIMIQNGNIPYYQANMEELNNTIKELNHLFQFSH